MRPSHLIEYLSSQPLCSMSKTYKKGLAYAKCFRHPKGKKQAIINGARLGAIPPDAWDDLSVDWNKNKKIK